MACWTVVIFSASSSGISVSNSSSSAMKITTVQQAIDFEPGIFQRVDTCGNAVMDEAIHPPRIFCGEIICHIKTLHAACDLGVEIARVKILNQADSGVALTNIAPGFVQIAANRGNDAHAGDHDATISQHLSALLDGRTANI